MIRKSHRRQFGNGADQLHRARKAALMILYSPLAAAIGMTAFSVLGHLAAIDTRWPVSNYDNGLRRAESPTCRIRLPGIRLCRSAVASLLVTAPRRRASVRRKAECVVIYSASSLVWRASMIERDDLRSSAMKARDVMRRNAVTVMPPVCVWRGVDYRQTCLTTALG